MKIVDCLKEEHLVAVEYPGIHLDTFAYCNAKCVFCGYHDMKRPKGVMSMELLERLVDEMAGWQVPPAEIVPIHYGEFFLNPDWLDVLWCIEAGLPNTKIAIPTNGSVLDNIKIEQLVKIKTLSYVSFSLYAYFEETYERLIGLDVDVMKKIENAVTRLKALRPDIQVATGSTKQLPFITEYEATRFAAKWNPICQFHPLTANRQVNRKFMRDYPYSVPCKSIFLSMFILWDGRVSLCCYDPDAELMIGDTSSDRLLDIWNGERAREYQRLHSEGKRDEIPLCKTCTFAY